MIYREDPPGYGYQELADHLRDEITSGRIRPGQLVASESRLSQEYGVATKTARAALQQLRDEGLAELRRGYGVVVREQPAEVEAIVLPPGHQVTARTPTPRERRVYEVPEGVPLLVVIAPDGVQEAYPAHRFRIVPPPAPTVE